MVAPPTDSDARPSLRLLGGAALFASDGTSVTGPVAQRHRLALLAILAMAAPGGVQRERLTALLWPERDKESARNLLRVALHAVRQVLGHDALPTVGTEVRLDVSAVRVDAVEFDAALARGDAAAAVRRYGGPLLDGVHLDQDADAFEEWCSAERARLARQYETALEQLAVAAEQHGDVADAAARWQALAAARPTDARIARRCVEALVNAGDTAAAVAHARTHTARVQQELGAPPDAALVARVDALTTAVQEQPVAGTPAPVMAADVVPARRATDAPRTAAAPAPVRRADGPRVVVLVGAIAAIALAVAAWSTRTRTGASTTATRASESAPLVVALLPLLAAPDVPDATREGFVSLLRASLDQVPELRMVRPVAGTDGRIDTMAVLRQVHAGAVLTGALSVRGDELVATVALVDSAGVERSRTTARAPRADLAKLVDEVAIGLLRELWGRRLGVPEPRLAAIVTSNPVALDAFLHGEAQLRAAAWDSAVANFSQAVDADSTFALAQLRLAEAFGWRGLMGTPAARRALATAKRFADRLPPRERLMLAVRDLHEATSFDAVEASSQLVARYPGDAEARYMQADIAYHASEALGLSARVRAISLFDTAIALDSTSARVLVHPLAMALDYNDRDRYERLAALAVAQEPSERRATRRAELDTVARVRFAAPGDAVRAFESLVRSGRLGVARVMPLLLATTSAVLAVEEPEPALLRRAYDIARTAYRTDPLVGPTIDTYYACLLVGLGQMDEARRRFPTEWSPNCILEPIVWGYAPDGWRQSVQEALSLSRELTGARPDRREVQYRLALLRLAEGAMPQAEALLGEVITPRAGEDSMPAMLGIAVEAARAWARLIDGDSASALKAIDAAFDAMGYNGRGIYHLVPLRLHRIQMLMAQPRRRREALDLLAGMIRPTDRVSAWRYLELARGYALEGDVARAAAARRKFDALWKDADPFAKAAARAVRTDGSR